MKLLRYYSKSFEIILEMIRNLFGPRKTETQLYFEAIGLTLSVPRYLSVLTKKQLIARFKKAANRRTNPAASFASGDNSQTLFVARNAENYYLSGIMISLGGDIPVKAKNEYYEFLQHQLNDLKDRYKNFARVLAKEESVDGAIGGIDFEKTRITAEIPGEILYHVYYYHGFNNGYQILLCAMFSGEKRGMDLVGCIENASFS